MTAKQHTSQPVIESSNMEYSQAAVLQDPGESQVTNLIPVVQTTVPGSITTTEQIVNNPSLAPELESLSSGSEPEDQFYEAPEEQTVESEQQGASEAVGTDQDREPKSTIEDIEQKDDKGVVFVEQHDGGGMSRDRDSSCEQQRSVDSVDKEFVMVNYPTTSSSDQSDIQQPHLHVEQASSTSPQDNIQQATATCPQDNTSPVDSGDIKLTVIEGTQTIQDGNQSSAVQPESTESAQRSAGGSQEVTINVEEESEGTQQEIEGEVKGGSEVGTERESSDADGEKGQVSARSFESLGLLYASSPNIKHNRYMYMDY